MKPNPTSATSLKRVSAHDESRNLPKTPGRHFSCWGIPNTGLYRCIWHFRRCRSGFHCTGPTDKQRGSDLLHGWGTCRTRLFGSFLPVQLSGPGLRAKRAAFKGSVTCDIFPAGRLANLDGCRAESNRRRQRRRWTPAANQSPPLDPFRVKVLFSGDVWIHCVASY